MLVHKGKSCDNTYKHDNLSYSFKRFPDETKCIPIETERDRVINKNLHCCGKVSETFLIEEHVYKEKNFTSLDKDIWERSNELTWSSNKEKDQINEHQLQFSWWKKGFARLLSYKNIPKVM